MTSRVEIGVVGVGPVPSQLAIADVPETVVLNFAKLCNLWCGHCLYPEVATRREEAARQGHKEVVFLPPSTVIAVADEMAAWPRTSVLRIAADGEPLLHPEAIGLIRAIKDRGVRLSMTTNGIALSEAMAGALLDLGIDVIDISIDAARKGTFGAVRPSRAGANFYDRIESNVIALIEERNRRAASTQVMVNMIDQPRAHDDVRLFIAQWTARGADAVLIRPFHSTSAQTIQVGVITIQRESTRFPCKFPFTRLNVGFDHHGEPIVYYCSHDWTDQTIVGVLGRDGSLRDIWHGRAMEEIRRRHRENDYPGGSFCAACPDWYLGWGKSHSTLVSELSDLAKAR